MRTEHGTGVGAFRVAPAVLLVSSLIILPLFATGSALGGTDGTIASSSVTALSRWLLTTVDSMGDVGNDTSIAIDPYDNVHISYFDATNGDLKYATNADGSWSNYTLDSQGTVGKSTSIAVDPSGKVHISYLDWTNTALKYATNAGGTWAHQTVDDEGDVGLYSSIALDSYNNAHISYQDWTSYSLKYAANSGGSWTNQTIDSAGDVGYYTSIAIDSANKAHISYSDWMYDDLKYATDASGAWTTYTVDSSGFVGYETSIAVDSKDFVHISYNDDGNAALKYATNLDGSWVNYTLDDSSYAGMFSSIALDGEDSVHISYLDYWTLDNSVLKYATNETGSWEYYSVGVVGTAGYATSLALDSNGLAHIGYKDSLNNDLMYVFGTERDIPALVADFDAAPASGQPELTVQFTSNVTGGVEPYVFSWTFGDGGTDSSGNPVHSYAAEGAYTVTLTVTDHISLSMSVQKTIEVKAGGVEPIPEDDDLDLMLVFAVIPMVALAVTLVIAAVYRKRKAVTGPVEVRDGSGSAPVQEGAPDAAVSPIEPARSAGLHLASVEQRLFKLKEMRRKGLISEQEYDERTNELLGKW